MNRPLISSLLIVCAGGLFGCSPSPVRQAAATLAANTGRLNDEVEGLTRSRRQIEAARESLTQAMELSTLQTRSYTATRLATWDALKGSSADLKLRADLYQSAVRFTEDAAKRDAEIDDLARKVVAMRDQAKGDRSDKLADAAKSLASLSREPSLAEQLQFFAGYAKDVRDSLKKAKEDAAKAQEDAQSKVDALKASKKSSALPKSD